MERYGIPAGNVLRHYDVTGKICPNPYVVDADAWTAFLAGLAEPEKEELTKITGKSVATAEQMAAYLVSRNPAAAPYALEHAQIYLEEGTAENIRAMEHGHSVAWKREMIPFPAPPLPLTSIISVGTV